MTNELIKLFPRVNQIHEVSVGHTDAAELRKLLPKKNMVIEHELGHREEMEAIIQSPNYLHLSDNYGNVSYYSRGSLREFHPNP